MKSCNGDGAKGAQEGGYESGRTMKATTAPVPDWAKRAGTPVINPSLWTKRMLVLIEVQGTFSFKFVYAHQSLPEVNHQLESRMREIRTSGSEGGGANHSPYPYPTQLFGLGY